MLVQTGRVISIEADTSELEIGFDRANACAACAAGEGCGLGVFAGLLSRKVQSLRVDMSQAELHGGADGSSLEAYQPGDLVALSIPESWLLKAALWLYGLPLALGLMGAGIGAVLGVVWFGGQDAVPNWQADVLIALLAMFGIGVAVVLQRRLKVLAPSGTRLALASESALAMAGCRIRR